MNNDCTLSGFRSGWNPAPPVEARVRIPDGARSVQVYGVSTQLVVVGWASGPGVGADVRFITGVAADSVAQYTFSIPSGAEYLLFAGSAYYLAWS